MELQIFTDPVSIEGYTGSDLAGYYTGCYLLLRTSEGVTPVNVSRCESRQVWHVRNVEGDQFTVNSTDLYRFVLPQGFYIINGNLYRYKYLLSRSYKKGLYPDFIRLAKVVGGIEEGVRPNARHLNEMLNSTTRGDDATIITRRLAVQGGKLLTHYKTMSVGSFKDGVVNTPFPCIQSRLEEQQ